MIANAVPNRKIRFIFPSSLFRSRFIYSIDPAAGYKNNAGPYGRQGGAIAGLLIGHTYHRGFRASQLWGDMGFREFPFRDSLSGGLREMAGAPRRRNQRIGGAPEACGGACE